MNISKKLLALSLFFAVFSGYAKITRQELEAIGSVLQYAEDLGNELQKIPGYKPEINQYVFNPAGAIGKFLYNLDILDDELTKALSGIKNFKTLSACAKLDPKYLTMSETELKNEVKDSKKLQALMAARKLCPTVACTGDRIACTLEGIKHVSAFLTAVQKALFGYYKVDGKAYLICPEGKNCSRILGVAELALTVAQQQQIYRNVLNPKVNEPLAKVINVLEQLERILSTLKGASKQIPSSQVPAPTPVPVAPTPKAPEQTSSTIPEAPKLEETSSNIPDAPPLEERSTIPVAPPLVPSTPRPTVKPAQPKPQQPVIPSTPSVDLSKVGPEDLTAEQLDSEITRLSSLLASKQGTPFDELRLNSLKKRAGVSQPTRPVTQPTQKPAQQESMIGDKLRQDVAKALGDRRKAMAPEENWE